MEQCSGPLPGWKLLQCIYQMIFVSRSKYFNRAVTTLIKQSLTAFDRLLQQCCKSNLILIALPSLPLLPVTSRSIYTLGKLISFAAAHNPWLVIVH